MMQSQYFCIFMHIWWFIKFLVVWCFCVESLPNDCKYYQKKQQHFNKTTACRIVRGDLKNIGLYPVGEEQHYSPRVKSTSMKLSDLGLPIAVLVAFALRSTVGLQLKLQNTTTGELTKLNLQVSHSLAS